MEGSQGKDICPWGQGEVESRQLIWPQEQESPGTQEAGDAGGHNGLRLPGGGRGSSFPGSLLVLAIFYRA